jgi:hypothetical protein
VIITFTVIDIATERNAAISDDTRIFQPLGEAIEKFTKKQYLSHQIFT